MKKTWEMYKAAGLCTSCGLGPRGRTLKCDLCHRIDRTRRLLKDLVHNRKWVRSEAAAEAEAAREWRDSPWMTRQSGISC